MKSFLPKLSGKRRDMEDLYITMKHDHFDQTMIPASIIATWEGKTLWVSAALIV
jgi:hypothetical protein